MIKKLTLFSFFIACALNISAQDFVFMHNNEVLDDNAEVTIKAIVEDLGGGCWSAEAKSNAFGSDDQYYVKAFNVASVQVACTGTVLSSTGDNPNLPGLCFGGLCQSLPVTKNATVTNTESTKLECDLDFTKGDYSGVYEGTTKVKLVGVGGSTTRTLYITFTNVKEGGVENAISKLEVKVINNTLITNISKPGDYSAHIYSMTGQEVKSLSISENGESSLSDLATGIYIYVVTENGSVLAKDKFVIK